MKVIVCTGDSHTWGQGAAGVLETLSSTAQTADRRLTGFAPGCYVNRVRRAVAQQTGSVFEEWGWEKLQEVTGHPLTADGVTIGSGLQLELTGCLIRLQLRRTTAPCSVTARLDGVPCGQWSLTAADAGPGFYGMKNVPLFTVSGRHTLELTCSGEAHLYRVETYDGPWAVINAGIGSCPATRYLREFWEDEVAAYRPAIVLAEAHSINDWLSGITPDAYAQCLTEYIGRICSMGAAPLLMTVSPILGQQVCCGAVAPYEDFVRASIQTAAQTACPLIDAHAAIVRAFDALPAHARETAMFDDNWHVSDRGHEIYAACAMEKLSPLL